MPEQQKKIEIRSYEVQEIMSHVPNWMIRWGISLIFVLIALFLFLSYIIKYPDVIKGTIELTTLEPPVKLVSKNAGEIEHLFFENNTKVKKGDIIINLNDLLSFEDKKELEIIISSIYSAITNNKLESYLIKDNSISYGTIQTEYSTLIKYILEFQNLINNNTGFNIRNLKQQLKNNRDLKTSNQSQLKNAITLLKNATDKFNSDQQLYDKGIISKMAFFEENQKFINAKNNVENYKKTIIQNSITITELEKQLNNIEFDYNQEQTNLLQNIKNYLSLINNSISNWELNYQISSPINGKLTYLGQLNERKFIEKGKELFAIIPDNQQYIGYVKIPRNGYGKIKKGQKVRIKLDNFPYHEYGQINGKVNDISIIPNENSYLIKVILTDGLISSYKKEFIYSPEMAGSAEIITEDLRLLDRVFSKFRTLINN